MAVERIVPNSCPVVGVDLGGTKILAAVVDSEGRILSRAKKKTKVEGGALSVLSRMAFVIHDAIKSSGIPQSQIAAIGVGSPGPLNPETGVVLVAPNLGWKNVNVKAYLEGEFKIPVFLENDVNAGTVGEHRLGAAKGVSSLVGIFVGTGIGGGIVLGGKLYRGYNQTAGEIGHMVIDPKGPLCACGKQGCLESFASRTAIDRMIRERLDSGKKSLITDLMKKDSSQIKSSVLAEALYQHDKVVTEAIETAVYYLGVAVGGLINFLNPEMIVLGGGVVEAMKDFYLAEVHKTAIDYSFPHASQGIRIVAARLGDDSGILGAAVIAQTRISEQSPSISIIRPK